MNAEQKQRAKSALTKWCGCVPHATAEDIEGGNEMAALLEELINAPSVPDGWIRAVDEAMVVHHIGIADSADSYEVAKKKLNALLAINSDIARDCSEPPADLARDAERWNYTAQDGYFEIRNVTEGGVSWVVGIEPKRGTAEWRKGHIGIWTTGTGRTRTAAIDKAIERNKKGMEA